MSISKAARATPARVTAVTLGTLALALAAVVVSLLVGVEHVSLSRALADRGSLDADILFAARAPRIALGALADPYVLGVSGGAAAAGTAAALIGGASLLGIWTRPAFAFLGALGAVAMV